MLGIDTGDKETMTERVCCRPTGWIENVPMPNSHVKKREVTEMKMCMMDMRTHTKRVKKRPGKK